MVTGSLLVGALAACEPAWASYHFEWHQEIPVAHDTEASLGWILDPQSSEVAQGVLAMDCDGGCASVEVWAFAAAGDGMGTKVTVSLEVPDDKRVMRIWAVEAGGWLAVHHPVLDGSEVVVHDELVVYDDEGELGPTVLNLPGSIGHRVHRVSDQTSARNCQQKAG